MLSAAHIWTILRRAPLLALAVAILAIGMAGASLAPAMAQEQQGWSLRNLLFPRKSERLEPPPARVIRPKPKKSSVPRKPVEPEIPIVEKAPEARVILVIGDFLASGLADGLEAVFAENPGVRVADRSNGSSGLVRDDFFDWPQQVDALIDAEKPAAVVVMLGSNDRQQMQVGAVREPPRSEAWTLQYEERTQALGKAIAAHKVPFLWVGVPAFKTAKMTSDMLAFNDIYHAAAQDNGGEFIDIWDGFVDENGAFVTTGPDINGQPVRLRADDGINVTRAGKRKLAFYTEKSLMKILGLTAPEGSPLAAAPAGEPVKEPTSAAAPAIVNRTVPMLLSDPALDGGTELLGAVQPANSAAGNGSGSTTRPEAQPTAQPGRADDFSWPPSTATHSAEAKAATNP